MIFSLLPKKKLILTGVMLAGIVAVLFATYRAGQKDVQADWDAYALEESRRYIEQVQEAARRQEKVNAELESLRGQYEKETSNLRSTVADLNRRLRDRPTRPAPGAVSQTATTERVTTGCTGRELYREDGEFLVREAERAETLRQLLAQCRAAYNSLR